MNGGSMTRLATVVASAQTGGRYALSAPAVWIDGAPRSDVRVHSLAAAGPIDLREAVLVMDRAGCAAGAAERARHGALLGRSITVGCGIDLGDAEPAMLMLFAGRITHHAAEVSGGRDRAVLHASDAWSEAAATRLFDAAAARTVGELLDQVGRAVGRSRWRDAVTDEARADAVRFAPRAGVTVEAALAQLRRSHGIVVQQRIAGSAGRADWRIEIRQAVHGRPVRLSAELTAAMQSAHDATRPVKLIGRADGQIFESTFELAPAWAATDELGTDEDYAAGDSSDWPRFANVFRLWSLTGPVACGEAMVDAASLRFGPCLTLDGAGERLPPLIEFSTDAGQTWQAWGGGVEVLGDAAAARLSDAALDAGYLAAARAGAARMRVTATIRPPLPIEAVRWIGNPFTGLFDGRVIDFGDSMAVRRVLATSRFAGDVAAGHRNADEADDRPRLREALVRASLGIAAGGEGSTTLRLSRPAVGLAVGDRLMDPSGVTWASVVSVEHRWSGDPQTRVVAAPEEGGR